MDMHDFTAGDGGQDVGGLIRKMCGFIIGI
jgi:hypothetical protein